MLGEEFSSPLTFLSIMKIFALENSKARVLNQDIKVIGYGLERDLSEVNWDTSAHLVNLTLEGEFVEKLLTDVPTSFLNVEPFYSLDRVSLRLIRPFHLRRGWELTFELPTAYRHRLLLYCVFEDYPSTKYLHPTKIKVERIGTGENKQHIFFPVDVKLISFGFDFSSKITQPETDWLWGLPLDLKLSAGVISEGHEIITFTDGEYVRAIDWFGSITTNGSKRSIENVVVRKHEYIKVYLEKEVNAYITPPGQVEPYFYTLVEYVNIGLEHKEEKPVSLKGIPKIKIVPVKIVKEEK